MLWHGSCNENATPLVSPTGHSKTIAYYTSRLDESGMEEPFTTGEELLDRAKRVARDVDERLRKLIEKAKQSAAADTDFDVSPLPEDPTAEKPPIP